MIMGQAPASLRRLAGSISRRLGRAIGLLPPQPATGERRTHVYVMRLRDRRGVNGTIRQLSAGGRHWQSMIDAAGRAVVFWGSDEERPVHHLWLAPLNQAEPLCLTDGPNVNGQPYWCPNGRQIVFFSTAGASETAEWTPSGQFDPDRPAANLWLMDVETGKRRQLTEGPSVGERPAVSPDGREVVFVSNRSGAPNIWRVDLDGAGLHQVTAASALDYRPVFSPDGRCLAYFTIALDGSHRLAFLSWPEAEPIDRKLSHPFVWVHGPFWSADGRTVLVHGMVRKNGRQGLWTIDIKNGTVRPMIVPGVADCSHGTWDSAERWITFDSHLSIA